MGPAADPGDSGIEEGRYGGGEPNGGPWEARRRARVRTSLLVAAAASILVLFAVTMASSGDLRDSLLHEPSPGPDSAALSELTVSTRAAAASAPAAAAAAAAAAHKIGAGLPPSRAPSQKAAPAQRLEQILAQGSHDRPLPMLEEKDYKRALACPFETRCSFAAETKMHERGKVTEYESKGDGTVEPEAHTKVSDMTAGMTMYFDIYETGVIGCTEGHIVYAINFTNVEEDDIVVTDNGRQADTQPGKSEKEVLETLNLNPFYVLQDIASGNYVNFVSPSTELRMYLDLKRSLFKDLNPVIDSAAETAVGPAGEKLFMHYEHDLNGRHRTTVMLRQDEHGRTETQHIRKMVSSQSLYEEDEQDSSAEGPPSHGNGTCPYPEPNKDEGVTDQAKTATSVNGAIDTSKETSHSKIGEAPNQVHPANGQSARDEQKSGQNPVGSSLEITAEYHVFRTGTAGVSGACSNSGSGAASAAPATAAAAAMSTPLSLASTHHAQSLFQWRANVELLTATSDGIKSDLVGQTESRMVVRPFKAHMLYDQSKEEADKVVPPARAQATVQHLIEGIGAANKANERIDTKGMTELRGVCHNHQLRSVMFKWLATPDAVNQKNKRTVVKFMGSCGAILAASTFKLSNEDKTGNNENSVLGDLSALINNDKAPEFVRDAGLQALVDLECPTPKTLEEVNELGTSLKGSALGETATLTLGALLRKHRYCHEGAPAASSKKAGLKHMSQILAYDPKGPSASTRKAPSAHLASSSDPAAARDSSHTPGRVFEAGLDARLLSAVEHHDTDDAETTLLSMANSAAPEHLLAVARSLEANKDMMRSYELRQAVKRCISSIGQHGGGNAGQESTELMQAYDATPSKTTMLAKRVDARVGEKFPQGHLVKTTAGEWKADFWFASADGNAKRFTFETTESAWRQFFERDFDIVFKRTNIELVKDATVISLSNPKSFEQYVEKKAKDLKSEEKFWVGARWSGQVSFKKAGKYNFRTQTGGGASMLTIGDDGQTSHGGRMKIVSFAKSVFMWFKEKDDFSIKNVNTGVHRKFGDWYLEMGDEMVDGDTLVSRGAREFAATFKMCNLYVYKGGAQTPATMAWSTRSSQNFPSNRECKSDLEKLKTENDCPAPSSKSTVTKTEVCKTLDEIKKYCGKEGRKLQLVLTDDGHLGLFHPLDDEHIAPFWISRVPDDMATKYPSTKYFFRAIVRGDGRIQVHAYPQNQKCNVIRSWDKQSDPLYDLGESDGFSDQDKDYDDDLKIGKNYLESYSGNSCRSRKYNTLTWDIGNTGKALTSQNGIYELEVIQDEKMLFVANIIGKPLEYRTNLPNAPGCKGLMTDKGTFKIVRGGNDLFETPPPEVEKTTAEEPAKTFKLLMQQNGVLVLYNQWKRKLWASGDESSRAKTDDSKNVLLSDMDIGSIEREEYYAANTVKLLQVRYAGAFKHASLMVEYSGPDTGDEWAAISSYSGGDQMPVGENVDLVTLPTPPPQEVAAEDEEEDDEEEDENDPASCLGGEDPLVCYGKRVPESGAVRGLITLDAGKAEAKEIGNGNKCQNYGFIRGEATAEIYTGLPWDGWDPYVAEILQLEGRYLMGPKCHCSKIGLNTCPSKKECKAAGKLPSVQKKSKAEGKNKIGGHLSIFGFVLKTFGKLQLQDPHSDAEGASLVPQPPSGTLSTSKIFKNLQGNLVAVEAPAKRWGFCGFQESEYSIKDEETTKQKEIPGLNNLAYWVGPVRVGINAHIKMALGGEIGVTANHQESSQLTNGKFSECQDGGRSGQGTSYVKTVLEISGGVTIVFAKGHIGCDLTFFSAQATGNAELLSGGYGKEAYIGFQAISGEIFAELSLAEFSYSWRCRKRIGRRERCIVWTPDVSIDWVDAWRKVIWAFKARFDSGNLLCDGLSDVGCAEYEENVGRKLFQIMRTVDAFTQAAQKLWNDVKKNELELKNEEASKAAGTSDAAVAERGFKEAAKALESSEDEKERNEDLIEVEKKNIVTWRNYKNSLYYQFRKYDKTRLPKLQCKGTTREAIEKNDNMGQLPHDELWKNEIVTKIRESDIRIHHDGDTYIDNDVARQYKKGGSARRRLLSASSETPAALKATFKKVSSIPAPGGSRVDGESQGKPLSPPKDVADASPKMSPAADESVAKASPSAREQELWWWPGYWIHQAWFAAQRAWEEHQARIRAQQEYEAHQRWLRQVAYLTSLGRIQGDRDMESAKSYLQDATDKIKEVGDDKEKELGHTHHEEYGWFWLSKTAVSYEEHIGKVLGNADWYIGWSIWHYEHSWTLWQQDRNERIATAKKVENDIQEQYRDLYTLEYKQAEDLIANKNGILVKCFNYGGQHGDSPDENQYKDASECRKDSQISDLTKTEEAIVNMAASIKRMREEGKEYRILDPNDHLYINTEKLQDSLDDFSKRWKDYDTRLKEWGEKIWVAFVEHHRENDPCFYVDPGNFNGVDPWCYQTTFTAAACEVNQMTYNQQSFLDLTATDHVVFESLITNLVPSGDIKRRLENIDSAKVTIENSKARVAEMTKTGGELDIKKQEAEARRVTYSEKLTVLQKLRAAVQARNKIINGVHTVIGTYNSAKKKWEDAKTKVEQFLTFVGMCAYQDVDPVSGRRMRMLYQVPPTMTPLIAPSKVVSDLASKPTSPTTQLAQASKDNFPIGSAGRETGCAYIDPQGGDYRGLADVDSHGRQCLPWPKSYALQYAGSGLAKNIQECDDLVPMSSCWESCKFQQETNNYCRNPTDGDLPYCRIGGTEEDPQWSFCSQLTLCEDTGCTHNLEDESDYDGMVHQSEKGDFCLDWSDFPDYAEVAIANNWGSSCRNLPNGDKARAWCFTGTVSDATPAYCDIGRRCPPEHDEKEPPDDDDDEGETGDSNPAGLSSATSRSSPRRAALMYARSAEEARARLNQQMETMGYSMPDEL